MVDTFPFYNARRSKYTMVCLSNNFTGTMILFVGIVFYNRVLGKNRTVANAL
jgi:hypothetical protein